MKERKAIEEKIREYEKQFEAMLLPGSVCPSCGATVEKRKWMRYEDVGDFFIRNTKLKPVNPCCKDMAAKLESIEPIKLEATALISAARIELLQGEAGVPPRYADSSFDNYVVSKQSRPLRDALLKYVENIETNIAEGYGIYMAGDYGAGKTHLAAAVMREAMLRLPTLTYLFGSLSYTIHRIKRSFEKDGSNCDDRDIVDNMVCADLIVIDDLGKEHDTPWVRSMAYLIINERYNQKRATIYTTNEDYDKLVARYDAPTMSRITGTCLGLKFMNIGDYRQTQAQQARKELKDKA